ncbi:MAG: AMP-binding protein [Rickettsiales bacterium]|nr:AMP-binding protein [Rickettsiales bacterium]
MFKSMIYKLLKFLFRVKVEGLEHYEEAGDRVLIVANHTSFLDAMLIAAFLPKDVTFAVNTYISRKWWMRIALSLVNHYTLDPTNPMATKSLIETIQGNKKCVIFPEGRITVTGSLMKIYEGPGMIADKADATILPIRIDGAEYSTLSRMHGKLRLRWFPKIRIVIKPPAKMEIPSKYKGRTRRYMAGNTLYDIMSEMMFESSEYRKPIFSSLIDSIKRHGNNHIIAEDINRTPITYRQFIMKSFILGNQIATDTDEKERVGVLLPNMVASAITFFALQSRGRVPAMLNFSTGISNLISACKTAELKTIYTSNKFVKQAELGAMIAEIKNENINVIFLENLSGKISLMDKLKGFEASFVPNYYYEKNQQQDADDEAVVLFTSGSEGKPKGVVLSHTNIQANRCQLASRVDFGPTDKVFNALPMFHSFGLTAGTLLPIMSGIKVFFYPSPLHYRIVPELIYDTNSTIMFGTDTFLAGYAKYAHPYDFYSIRYVFAGAEKLKDETQRLWSQNFGIRIFEGYGATETAPALTTNTAMHYKKNTVGRFLPGIQYRLEEVPGIYKGGRLFVKGPNVMKGYLMSDEPGVLVPPPHGWYDTGDIVSTNEFGFVTIEGRAKRFAKIGGEMVSLTAVELYVAELWPEHLNAVVAIEDLKKGEQLILVTDNADANRAAINEYFKKQNYPDLSIPKKVVAVEKLPLLGTGKIDYVTIKKIAESA